jgi:hypothetical protein
MHVLLVGLIYWFWMTNEFMIDWIKVVWNQRPGKHGTLVLDDFNLAISGGMTSQLQVLDAVINKPFKVHLQQLYNDWLLKGNHALTLSVKLKKPSIS